jgi:transcriptional regulator with XRE-family HTH domain
MRKPKKTTPLRQVREASGLSQKQFADYLGLGQHLYHSLELGRVGLSKDNAETISQKTGATPESIDRECDQARDFSGRPYTSTSWIVWQKRGLDWIGPMRRVRNVLDWIEFLSVIAEREKKINEFSFDLADAVTKVMDKFDLRRPVELELARSKVKVGLICTYGDLRRDGKLAKKAEFEDDPNVPDDARWDRRISYVAAWEPQAAFPFEVAERVGLNRSSEAERSPKTRHRKKR